MSAPALSKMCTHSTLAEAAAACNGVYKSRSFQHTKIYDICVQGHAIENFVRNMYLNIHVGALGYQGFYNLIVTVVRRKM